MTNSFYSPFKSVSAPLSMAELLAPAKNSPLMLPNELLLEENTHTFKEHNLSYDEPLIQFVEQLIQHASYQNASDVHIEPFAQQCRIRYRQDGILRHITNIPLSVSTRLIARLKVLAKLDISERRLPQDGHFKLFNIDIRINSCPTIFGEKIVLRLLESKHISLNTTEIGLTEKQHALFIEKISQPQGIILVTGPTGSGKTVTLYSALNHLNQQEKNILTVEDPVEIQLHGINQVHINTKIGLSFSATLRAFLRQDPDIIMIGEIRDTETAETAIQAAQTGHLVLSTLHTNSAIETLTRLLSMGITPYNIISSISLIIAQRLVRRLCPHCKQYQDDTYHAAGCEKCLHGYQGRTGIYELLPITENLIQLILSNAHHNDVLLQAEREGFINLKKSGLEKIQQGITTLAELKRVSRL